MADTARGMGRGLAAILSSTPRDAEVELREVPLDLVSPNPRQPRREFDEDALAGLAASLRERGVLQPIVVRPLAGGAFELIAGERRWRAARLAGMEAIPAVVRPDQDSASLELALIENMAREDLNPIEEARACAALVEELGLTHEDVGVRVGRSRVAVSNLIRLLDLPDEALGLIEAGDLTEGHGRALLLAADHDARRRLAATAARERWSVRTLETRAREASGNGGGASGGGRFRRGDVALHPDHAHAIEEVATALGAALGREVRVRPSGTGCRVEIEFEAVGEALLLASRMAPRAAA